MKNRETAYPVEGRTAGRNSRKDLKDKRIWASQTDTCRKTFADLLPSEKAAVMKALYDMTYDSEQNDDVEQRDDPEQNDDVDQRDDMEQCNSTLTKDQFGCYSGRCRSRKELAERFGYSSRNVARYLRINDLIRPIRDLVDGSRISLVAAVELSYLAAGEQWLVYRGILSRGLKLIHRAAEELRKHSGELTEVKSS